MFGVILTGTVLYLVKMGNKLTPDWVIQIGLLPLPAHQHFTVIPRIDGILWIR